VNMFLRTILMNPPVISALGFSNLNRRLFASVSVYLHAQQYIIVVFYLEQTYFLFNKEEIGYRKNNKLTIKINNPLLNTSVLQYASALLTYLIVLMQFKG
jgi:hypothetical protein